MAAAKPFFSCAIGGAFHSLFLGIVAMLAARLQVAFIPKQSKGSPMWHDVIHNRAIRRRTGPNQKRIAHAADKAVTHQDAYSQTRFDVALAFGVIQAAQVEFRHLAGGLVPGPCGFLSIGIANHPRRRRKARLRPWAERRGNMCW